MPEKETALDKKLETYAEGDFYPFHMPGHKRAALDMPNPYTIDITEIDGFDDLHAPHGILQQAQERAAELYGANKSRYLVNGSTCGILAAVSAAVPAGGRILMARNAHKSVYHAAYLRNLSTVYLYPAMTRFGILGAVSPQDVENQLERHPDIKAVLITSPTYEGVTSNIREIAETAHWHGIPLIVDEAHGAHFGLHPAFPETAVRQGADLVIQSMHKVLPSLTQTALLHCNTGYISLEAVDRFLDIYETSSPSYVLMAGMEKCIRMLRKEGRKRFDAYTGRLFDFYDKTQELRRIHCMGERDFLPDEIYGLDPSKIVISVKNTNLTGEELYQKLRRHYHLQMEMASGFYCLGMTSVMDKKEGFDRLSAALKEIDRTLFFEENAFGLEEGFLQSLYAPKQKKMEFYEALDYPVKEVSFAEAEGNVSGSMVSLYPPGIPILVPGERIGADIIKNIRKCTKIRRNLRGIADIINERIDIVDL